MIESNMKLIKKQNEPVIAYIVFESTKKISKKRSISLKAIKHSAMTTSAMSSLSIVLNL